MIEATVRDKPPLYGYQNDHVLMLIAAMYDKWGLSIIKYPKNLGVDVDILLLIHRDSYLMPTSNG